MVSITQPKFQAADGRVVVPSALAARTFCPAALLWMEFSCRGDDARYVRQVC